MKNRTILLALSALAAPLALHGADATTPFDPVYATGTADLWVSIWGTTCVGHEPAALKATLDSSGTRMASFEVRANGVEVQGSDGQVRFNETGGVGACAPNTMPIVVDRIDCDAGTAHLEAYVQGVKAVSFDATVECHGPLCFEHEPSALTNACLDVRDGPFSVPTPTVTPGWKEVDLPSVEPAPAPVCVLGPFCATPPGGIDPSGTPETLPWATVGSTSTPLPSNVTGYVEVTALCGATAACRVTL